MNKSKDKIFNQGDFIVKFETMLGQLTNAVSLLLRQPNTILSQYILDAQINEVNNWNPQKFIGYPRGVNFFSHFYPYYNEEVINSDFDDVDVDGFQCDDSIQGYDDNDHECAIVYDNISNSYNFYDPSCFDDVSHIPSVEDDLNRVENLLFSDDHRHPLSNTSNIYNDDYLCLKYLFEVDESA